MSSHASRRSRDAEREALKRQADRSIAATRERDELMALVIQAKALLDAGDVEAASNALVVGASVEVLPKRVLDLMAFAADFNALCLKRKVRAAWFTTTPDESDPTGQRVTLSTGGESHHDALLGRAFEALAAHNAPTLPAPTPLLSPDEISAAFPAGAEPIPFPGAES